MNKISDHIKHNTTAHDKIAGIYNIKHSEIYNDLEQNRLDAVVIDIIEKTGKKSIEVLDVGAGTGNLTKKFIKNNCIVTACDVSKESLALLQKELDSENLKTVLYDGKQLPFADGLFDVVATYSVLHHIPDYFFAIEEMIRVAKEGGLIYIDHEANENKWSPDEKLKEYYKLIKQTKIEHFRKLLKTKELFTFDFIKTIFIRLFNSRYQREGDIHVWPNDHMEWEKIKEILKTSCEILEENDYLLCRTKKDQELYNKYSKTCTDTKYLIAKKIIKTNLCKIR